MDVKVSGCPRARAIVTVPASKSISHRALIAASLAEGTSTIRRLVDNADTQATIRCLRHLGADVENAGDTILVHGKEISYDGEVLDCGESGSTLRFLIPIAAVQQRPVVFTGHGRLMHRPLDVYADLFAKENLSFAQDGEYLRVQGPLSAGTFDIDGSISSQFITGLLFALPLLSGDSLIRIRPPYESRSYVGLTEQVLVRSGLEIQDDGLTISIKGSQHYQPINVSVEGDASQAAFFGVLAGITDTSITLQGLNPASRQGDMAFVSALERAGVIVETSASGDGFVISGAGKLHSGTIDLADCPDLGPVLFALASQCEGTTVFTNAGRLRVKESDRIACMEEEMGKMGCDISSTRDTVTVRGRTAVRGNVEVDGHNDHRIVMALAVLAGCADGPVTIHGAEAINKSYPGFFDDLRLTGMEVQ